MPMNDVFGSDQFGLVQLTEAINILPTKPGRIGQMGLFADKGVPVNQVLVEERDGILMLLPSVQRGAPATQAKSGKRRVRSFVIPHIPLEDAIKPEDIQGVRKFGTENELESQNSVMNDKLQTMKDSHEVTLEWLRAGALHGKIVDGDGTTSLYNLFTEFNIAEPAEVDFLLGTETTKLRDKFLGVAETIEDALGGGMSYDHIHCLCSRTWFRKFIDHPEIKYSFQYYQENKFMREDPRRGFEWNGFVFEVYAAKVGATPFVTEGKCRFFPVGVPGLFVNYFGPADFMETANTIGLPYYAKQEPMKFNRGVELHTQSNPLPLCTRPGVLVGGTSSN